MAIAKTTVTGPILDAQGLPYAGGFIRFTPSSVGTDDGENAVITQGATEVGTDAGTGDFSIDLAPSDSISYAVSFIAVEAPAGGASRRSTYPFGVVYVPDTSSVSLQSLLPILPPDAPTTEEISALLSSALAQAESAVGPVAQASWPDLQGITPSQNGTGGEVLDSDTGSHLAASGSGYDGPSVDNAGRYSWRADWSRWVRIGDTGISAKLDVLDHQFRHELVDDLADIGTPEQGVIYLVEESAIPTISGVVTISAGTSRAIVQQTINDNTGNIIRLLAGTHRIGPIDLPSDSILEVTPLATIQWDLAYTLVNEDALFRLRGSDENNLVENVLIEALGELDADSTGMSGQLSQLEGIDIKRTDNCMIRGNGIVRNTSMDGIDLDASRNVRVIGMSAIDCGGYGLHHGGSPSVPSDSIDDQNSLVSGFRAEGCGFTNSRGGIDINGLWGRVTLSECIMIDNYRNYTFDGGGETGRIVTACQSIVTGAVTVQADSGQDNTDYCQINDRLWLGGTEITAS